MDSLVTFAWLQKNLQDSDLVILDCTVLIEKGEDGKYGAVSGRPKFDKGHIPGASFADLMGALIDTESGFGFAVPAPEHFVKAMSDLGVGDGSKVVLYDSNGSIWAARVWWMLRWIGFDQAALLDGGQKAWIAAGGELTADSTSRQPGNLSLALRANLIAEQDEVLSAIDNDAINLVDALTPAQYRGESSHYGRPGHIPTATNVPYSELVDNAGHYRASEELLALFDGAHDSRTINYCGGGIAASATAFIMTRLGYSDVAVYTASLQEWAADPGKPLVVGPDPVPTTSQ